MPTGTRTTVNRGNDGDRRHGLDRHQPDRHAGGRPFRAIRASTPSIWGTGSLGLSRSSKHPGTSYRLHRTLPLTAAHRGPNRPGPAAGMGLTGRWWHRRDDYAPALISPWHRTMAMSMRAPGRLEVLSSSVYNEHQGPCHGQPRGADRHPSGIASRTKSTTAPPQPPLTRAGHRDRDGGLVGGQTLNVSYTGATFSRQERRRPAKPSPRYTTSGTRRQGEQLRDSATATTTTANIIPKTISATATGNDKIYDGTTTATATCATARRGCRG